ncbi:MAG TPA: class I SAM-dependent methyltransferase [Chthoniobacterales bacterium]|nr:class I SAM-dependent methyltransferase [Chthoniobacterales bacterium]
MKTTWIDRGLMRDFEAEGTNAYRLCTAADGWIERFGNDVLLSFKNEAARERLTTEYFLWAEAAGFTLERMFGRFLPKHNEERSAPKPILGDANANSPSVVTERHLRYDIDFSGGYSVGLFIDQRENRHFVRKIAPKQMLNCFAYTCSFSVVAAAVGASTVSVDLSRKSLERGRENFALNNLPATGHHFIADDVFDVLPRLARKGEKFDLIVLDPPTFSRSRRGRTFQVESDFERLLLSALEVADRDMRILLSTNCSNLNERALEVMARFCLKTSRRAGKFHREPAPVEFPPGSGASTIWLTLR